MYVRNLSNEEFSVMATTKTDIHLNSDHSIEIMLEYNKVNKDFIADVDRMWSFFDNDETEYIVVHISKQGKGEQQTVVLQAIPTFFDIIKTDVIYEEYNGSITFDRACQLLFKDLPFSYIINGQFNAIEWEGFGAGEFKSNTLKRMLNRYGAEFEIVGKNVHFREEVGEDTNIMYAHRLNASDIKLDVDATSYYTFARGYGDYGIQDEGDGQTTDWQDAKMVRTYVSPLEQVMGRRRHAPPIKNGNITKTSTMDKKLRDLVEGSLKISITLTMHQLNKQGYEDYIPNVGDRIIIVDPRIGLNDEVRVQQSRITRDWKGKVLDYQAVVGSPSVVKRYQSQLKSAVTNINDILNGKTKLPFNVLDNAVINATRALQNAQTELKFPNTGGILAVDKTNPNLVTLYNSAGIGVSKDGGRTFKNAITGEGIVAEAIMAGVVHGLVLQGGEVLGGKFETTGGSSRVEIQEGRITTYSNGQLTSSVDGFGHDFYRNGNRIGNIGASNWLDHPNYLGLTFQLEASGSYMNWGYRDDPTDPSFKTMMSWHKNSRVMPKGLNINDDLHVHHALFVGKNCEVISSENGTRIGPNTSNNGTYIVINDVGQFGISHRGSTRWL